MSMATHLNFFHSLRSKLLISFLIVSLLPLLTIGWFSYTQAQYTLTNEVSDKLLAVRDIKAKQVTKYFAERLADVRVLAQNPTTIAAINAFEEVIATSRQQLGGEAEVTMMTHYRAEYLGKPNLINANDNSSYSAVHAKYHSLFKSFKEAYGYYDVFLVEPHAGNVVYTVMKENDFGTSLFNGVYAKTNLGKIFQTAVQASTPSETYLQDFVYYEVFMDLAAFIAAPIFVDTQLVGVLIFQLAIEPIDAIMHDQTGLGQTGESLLISSDDFYLRSNSRFVQEHTVLKQKMDTAATYAAAHGQTGLTNVIDSQGETTLVAYTPLSIPQVRWSLQTKVNAAEIFAATHSMLQKILLIMVIGTLFVIIIALWISNSIIQPILAITRVAGQLTEGHLQLTVDIQSQDEIGKMGTAVQQMIFRFQELMADIVHIAEGLAQGNVHITPQARYQGDFLKIKIALTMGLSQLQQVIDDIVQLSQALAKGNLNVDPSGEYQGDFAKIKTALTTALTNFRQVIGDIVQVSQGLAEGNQSIMSQAEYAGDFAQIKTALETASSKLAQAINQNATQDWLKTGQTQLNEHLRGDAEIITLAKEVITFLANYLNAKVGACYLAKIPAADPTATTLKLIASYAFTRRKNLANEFHLGEGLIGQAALEQEPIIITQVPEDYVHIQSALGEAVPTNLLVIPFLYEHELKGVIELGTFHQLTKLELEFLQQVMPAIAIAINTTQAREKMKELLQQSQTQAEELQSQSEELQVQQEELTQINEQLQVQQQQLQQTNVELEERTQDLERQKEDIRQKNLELSKSQQIMENKARELELASQYKSEFLANMSHELRTPLNSLLVLAKLLMDNKEHNLTQKQVEYARTIHSAGTDLLTIINDILDLSKVEAGKLEICMEDFEIAELVEATEHKFRPLAETKNLAFHINLAKDFPTVINSDKQRLQQIINNLLANAFKFTSHGGVKLDLRIADKAEVSKVTLHQTIILAFSVIDTGIGIPAEKQQLIFEAFQQADGTTSRRYGGTGLGLSISRQLAQRLNGEIQLASESGTGSTFTLYLPANAPISPNSKFVPNSAAILTNSITAVPTTVASENIADTIITTNSLAVEKKLLIQDDREKLSKSQQTILIIEDDYNFAHLLMELAHEKNFQCLIATDGKTGLQLAEQFKPTAILLDIGLPQMDGWTVMERLKDNPEIRHIPVHIMSGTDYSKDAKNLGAIGYLLKPVNMEQIGNALQKIERIISKTVKQVLLIVDKDTHQQEIIKMVKNENVQCTLATTIEAAFNHLQQEVFDCIILDIDVANETGSQFLELLSEHDELLQIPVILYADRQLTATETSILQRCSANITVKTVSSPESLLDEATLFLHQLEANLSKEKRNLLRMVHDKIAVFKNKKVLVVDDDMRNVFVLAAVLEEKEMEIIVANNGVEAITILEKSLDIAIVLMDIMMPEMDGYETIRKIRAQSRFHKLPIIALTAKAMKGDRTKCIEAGANDYLSKPVEVDKLISLMRVWLSR
jgi:signal transduction histidine kinase/DNA-binding response OmpR family regulator